MFRLQWEQKGPVLNLREPIERPETDNWREVWNASDHFDHHKNVYILVNGPEVRQVNPVALQILGRIPWSLVLDFDPGSKSGGLFEAVHLTLQKFRALRVTLPDNLQEINYKEATCWFMAAGLKEREDTLKPNYDAWRREYLPAVRNLSHILKKSASPQPVLVLMATDGLTEQYLRAIWECLDEVFEDEARYVVVYNGGINLENIKDKPGITTVQCSLTNLMSGLWQMYGSTLTSEQIRVPKRGRSENERDSVFLEDCDFQYLKEDLEVVHRGLVEELQDDRRVGHDFWRGHEVTWTELDMGADVHRELAEPLKKEILARLGESRNVSIPLYHTPGAGGTTLARRIAWDLKDIYPTVRIHHLSPHTASRIEMLFHKTGLPLLVLMESSVVPQPAREQLYKELKGRNIRAVFLYVVRNIKPRGAFSLADPMVELEANRFYERYKNFAPSGRAIALERLAHGAELQPYRSPFFFGLYAFEKEFTHIPDYVGSHITGITEDAKKILCFLALVTRFSQFSLTDVLMKGILNLPGKRPLRLNEVFGDGPNRLILYRDQKARIVHPLIAQEILKQLLASSNTKNSEEWKTRIVDLSCSFIESLVNVAGSESTIVLEILSQMFVSRDPWQERADRRRNFSELILEIPSDAGQHRILLTLKDFCPNEAHFWNHLGRHHIYVMHSKYEEAERCLTKAIELDSENDVHCHALGMVYRFEIRNQLNTLIKQKATVEQGLVSVHDILNKAEKCFENARKLDPETEHGYITHIQLLIEIIERLFRLSGSQDYTQFLSNTGTVAIWCRDKLPWAEELLRRVKNLHAQENLSRLTIQ